MAAHAHAQPRDGSDLDRVADGTGRQLKVFVHGEYWEADADEPMAVGDAVEVTAVAGLRVRVRRHAPH